MVIVIISEQLAIEHGHLVHCISYKIAHSYLSFPDGNPINYPSKVCVRFEGLDYTGNFIPNII